MLVSCLWLLLISPVHALLDTNSNGASDLWEKLFNDGVLYTDFDPAADPDGDGWTNAREAVAGTDPRNANAPDGCLRLEITRVPAVYGTPEVESGPPVLISPEAISIRWPTLAGKSYSLFSSVNLAGENWLPVGPARLATGSILGADFPLNPAVAAGFFRVVVEDRDTEGDQLTNHEEYRLGSNPAGRDSDFDGVSDWVEVSQRSTNPATALDNDGDAIPDDFEKDFSANLLQRNPDPASWGAYHAGLLAGNLDPANDYTGDNVSAAELHTAISPAAATQPQSTALLVQSQARGGAIGGYFTIGDAYNPGVNTLILAKTLRTIPTYQGIVIPLEPSEPSDTYFGGEISGSAWYHNSNPASLPLEIIGFSGFSSRSYYEQFDSRPSNFDCSGNYNQARLRLCATRMEHPPYTFHLLRVTTRKDIGSTSPGPILSVQPLTLQLARNRMLSGWIEVNAPLVDGKDTNQNLFSVVVSHVDRDVMGSQWAQQKRYDLAVNPPVYAGPSSGDMIEWRLSGGNQLQSAPFAWKAEHLGSGDIVTGPAGLGISYWRIANQSGNDASDTWLKWKPGDYLVTCEVAGVTMEIQRLRIGYRSDQILVIGQIVPTFTHTTDEPTGAALAPWANAIADDLSGVFSTAAGILPGIVEDELYDAIRSHIPLLPSKAAEAWTGVWSGGIPGFATPIVPPLSRGPAATSYGLNPRGPVGTITAAHRYWMIQHLLNTNSDVPILPDTLRLTPNNDQDRGSFPVVFSDKQYRFLQRFQARFLLDAQGKIENPASRVISHIADVGPTKLKAGIVTGELGSVAGFPIPWNDLLMDLTTEPAEANAYNGTINYSSDGTAMSGFATARIGLKGQKASYRQFGKDAPWIFSEIILQLDPQGEDDLMGRTSITVQWHYDTSLITPAVVRSRSPAAPASTPGISAFNNISIYTRSTDIHYNRLLGGILEMDGHLSSFVESASGAWPEPPIEPSIR